MFWQYLTIKFRRLFNTLVMFHNIFDGIIEPIRLFTLDGHRNKICMKKVNVLRWWRIVVMLLSIHCVKGISLQ